MLRKRDVFGINEVTLIPTEQKLSARSRQIPCSSD